jgi:hypothetical protein
MQEGPRNVRTTVESRRASGVGCVATIMLPSQPQGVSRSVGARPLTGNQGVRKEVSMSDDIYCPKCGTELDLDETEPVACEHCGWIKE